MKFTGKLVAPRINLEAYKEALHKALEEALSQACDLWLNATVDATVPVWSGASRATFLHLANKLGRPIDIAPVVESRMGQGLAEGGAKWETDKEKGLYFFEYSTTLWWLIVNEYHDATQWGIHLKTPGPYMFQVKGQAAFKHFANQVELPSVVGSIKRVTVKKFG